MDLYSFKALLGSEQVEEVEIIKSGSHISRKKKKANRFSDKSLLCFNLLSHKYVGRKASTTENSDVSKHATCIVLD